MQKNTVQIQKHARIYVQSMLISYIVQAISTKLTITFAQRKSFMITVDLKTSTIKLYGILRELSSFISV